MKGIRSPWAKPAEVAPNPLEGARKGKQPVQIRGRMYSFIVELPLRIDEERAQLLALTAFGEALQALNEEEPGFAKELAIQKLSLLGRPLGSCVTIPLGPVTLHALASSTDEATALAMAVDRLGLAVTRLLGQRPGVRDILSRHYTTLLRNT